MNSPARGPADDRPWWGPGIVELRHIASRFYGIRVQHYLVDKLANVRALSRANPRSDLFCIQVDAMDDSPEGAVRRFKEIAAEAGLGAYFGAGNGQSGR